MSLGLVAYASSDESDNEEIEEVNDPSIKNEIKSQNVPEKNENNTKSDEISDDEAEGEFDSQPSFLDDDENIPGLSSSSSLFSVLPSVSTATTSEVKKESTSYIDENEDLSTIPKAKTYSETPDLMAIKPKKKKGPIRIMAPSLITKLADDDIEKKPVPRTSLTGPSKVKSGLLSMLPPPKGATNFTNDSSTVSKSVSSTATTSTKPSLVPRSVARKPAAVQPKKNHDSDDEESDVPFFTMGQQQDTKIKFKSPSFSSSTNSTSSSLTVKSNPDAAHPKGIEPGSHPSHQYRYQEHVESGQVDYGPATAPYPPPMPAGPSAGNSNDDLLANQEALERLAGRGNKRRRAGDIEGQIIDVSYDEIKPDERVWVTNALSEDLADQPGPKNTIGGKQKRTHQITYLAAAAKENEHKLKATWATSAANRRASAQKYGF